MANSTDDMLHQAQLFNDFTAKQKLIIIAAIDVFAEKGYAATSTKEIAARAGVAEGNIYSRFTNKRGLLNAIITPVLDQMFPAELDDFIKSRLNQDYVSLETFLTVLIKDRITFLQANAQIIKIVLSELLNDTQVREQVIGNFTAQYWQTMTHDLTVLKQRGVLVDWPFEDILRAIWSTTSGLILGFLYFNQPLDADTVNHSITATIKALTPK
ncbi:TetR/AcrR family transcriptional regulator [Lacticaseibacillus casei]|jgi:AcrR family transcriptional regulator|uniref:Helix-turn-helix domain-containing protein n=2 Tax=Lacticaseibacillus TaxID=2759736 RepID=A0ABY9L2W2_9LACO|nr:MULTISPECIES: TetR/AcrR family transcriptional regulator [Lacticaseibacillus]MDE3281158.1 TetR/AcrR family transcriptional regulator [Lacticaseibacillus casei]MDG3062354.1 helix-turn-helix domain containing protein [Lacticaseibacillus sp. BCRC 81376]QVI36403.1 TetR/AcrR family transcriptional regulator [Lacticaseibacillus casei]WFB40323.1 helix-turn-helix domain containing protein [Lacticaseibacillus huelsenbergensis]WFB42075.1 helix-turn-helix domain containing protein [Lacticaseibacillus 